MHERSKRGCSWLHSRAVMSLHGQMLPFMLNLSSWVCLGGFTWAVAALNAPFRAAVQALDAQQSLISLLCPMGKGIRLSKTCLLVYAPNPCNPESIFKDAVWLSQKVYGPSASQTICLGVPKREFNSFLPEPVKVHVCSCEFVRQLAAYDPLHLIESFCLAGTCAQHLLILKQSHSLSYSRGGTQSSTQP